MEELALQQPEIIGRKPELTQLRAGLDSAMRSSGSTMLIEGTAGVGKTRVVQSLTAQAIDCGFTVLRGSGQPFAMFPYQLFEDALKNHLAQPLVQMEAMTGFSEIFAVAGSGLLINHVRAGKDTTMDSDILAGMLTAVQSFVKDSFGDESDDANAPGLRRLEYQQKKILIEYKTHFYLAGVIEGEEHPGMQSELASVARTIEDNSGTALKIWNGTPSKVDGVAPELDRLLRQRWRVFRSLANINLDAERLKIYDRALNQVLQMASRKPVMLVAEDLHWADEGSLGILLYIARNTKTASVFIVGTQRPERGEALGKTLEKMAQEELHSTLTIEGLVSEDIKAFAEAKLQGPVSDELIDAIYVSCEGNPLFARELINSGRHDKTIVLSEGLWRLQPGAGLTSASVEELIARRLHALSPTCFYTLDIAACLGREFHLRNLAIVYGNERIAQEAIAPLAAAGVLLVDANHVRFEHALVHETAYNMVGKRRQSHHRHIAESLESEYLGSQDYFLYDVAHHYGRSDVAEKSFKYNGMAGDKAASEHAVERAAAFYDVALAAMVTTPVRGKHYEERLAMLERLGDICTLGGMCDRALEAFEAGEREHHEGEAKARLLRKVASVHEMKGEYDKSLEILAGIKTLTDGKTAELGRARLEEGFVRYRIGEYEKALALYSEAIKMFERFGGEQKDFSEAFRAVGNIHWSKGEYDDAIRYYEKSLAVMEEIGEQYGIAAALNNIGVVHAEKGELDVALVFYGRSLEIREKIGDKQGIALSLNNIGALYYNGGELGRALEFYERSLEIREKIGDKQGIALSLNNIGVVHAENGELDVALEFYERSLEIREKIGDKQGIALSLNNIGIMHYWKGELKRALEFSGRSLALNEKIGDKHGIAMSLNTIGVLHHDRGDIDKALESYERGLMICLEIGEKRLAVPNYCGIAEVDIEAGNNEAGFENANKAAEVAVEIGAKSEEGMSHRMLGMVHRAKKEWDKANEEFEKAKRILGKSGDKKELARALYEHGRLYRDMGDQPKAKEQLDKALAEFERMGTKLWIEKCRKVIE